MTTKKTAQFEQSLQELNAIVEEMEKGQVPLEESLKRFERGITLIRQCQNTLKTAQQTVELLTRKNSTEALEPYQDEIK